MDTTYRLYQEGPGYHMANGEYIATEGRQGHRTRTYINAEAAHRAFERGEVYTLDAYTELTAVTHQRKRR